MTNTQSNTQGIMEWQKVRKLDQKKYDLWESVYYQMEELYEMIGFQSDEAKSLAKDNVKVIQEQAKESNLILPPPAAVIIDALLDKKVFGVGDIMKLGYDVEKCEQECLKEISSRQGAWSDEKGKWIKDPNQDPSTLYVADYDSCKIVV